MKIYSAAPTKYSHWTEKRGILQTVYGDMPGQGNCLAACIATYLNRTLEEVPSFIGDSSQQADALEEFAEKENLEWVIKHIGNWEHGPSHIYIAIGPSLSKPSVNHAVIGYENDILWDPHPDKPGISDAIFMYRFIRTDHRQP